MATAIFFNGRRIVVPQAVSRIDASALQATSPSAIGIVALLGTAEGGVPLTVDEQYDLTNPDAARDQYRSGDLKTASLFCFEPSQDDAVPGGASKIVPIKVNPATQSSAQLPDSLALPSVDLTSVGYGQFTEQVNIDVDTGTTVGKRISIIFEGTTETFDDIGGEAIFDVLYTPSTEGYSTALGSISSTRFAVEAEKAELGLLAQFTDTTPAGFPTAIEVVSSDVGDTTQTVTIYGLVGTTPQRETVSLNGTAVVTTVRTDWTKVVGVLKSAATIGTVTVRDTVPNTICTLAPATLTRGLVLTTNTPVADDVFTVSIDTNAAVDVVIIGTSPAGAIIMERFDMTTGTTPVVGATDFRSITAMALGDVAGARTVTVACDAVSALHATFPTVQRLVDRLNTLDGFTANAVAPDATAFLTATADYLTAVSLIGAAADFFANNQRFIEAINQGSQFMRAARATGATREPANTPSPVFLAGGTEGVVTLTQWQQAFRLLKKRRVNIVVPLTRDPAVHALALSHLIERAGRLRSEANGYVGIGTTGGAGEALATFRAQIQALNTRHLSAISQEVQRFDPDDGEATWYPPYFLAAIAAGMQAGSAIGEPLTRKIINALDLRNDASWSVEDDIDLLIDSGAMIAEKVDGLGLRWVRSVTTHLQDDNLVFTEMSANESANTAIFELRTQLDAKIGDRALASSAAVIKGLAADTLERLVRDEIIAAWRPKTLTVEQIGDVFPVSVEIAPVVPINFIPITVHLVPLRAAA
jgi:hypothetical protein